MGQNIAVNLPFPAASITSITGSYYYLDSGTANYGGPLVGFFGTSYCYMILPNAGVVGANPSILVANNDVLQFTCTYEVA